MHDIDVGLQRALKTNINRPFQSVYKLVPKAHLSICNDKAARAGYRLYTFLIRPSWLILTRS